MATSRGESNEVEITDAHLWSVFNEIKGADASRNFITFDDFKRACLQYRPTCLKNMILNSMDVENDQDLIELIENHFANICESCAPVVPDQETEASSPKFAGGEPEGDTSLLDDLGNIDEGPTAALPL